MTPRCNKTTSCCVGTTRSLTCLISATLVATIPQTVAVTPHFVAVTQHVAPSQHVSEGYPGCGVRGPGVMAHGLEMVGF